MRFRLIKFLKYIILSTPLINFLFIKYRYKILKKRITIHGFKSHKMIMSANNYQIYDKINRGKITGLDNNMNYEYAFAKKIIDQRSKNKIFFDIGAAYGHYSWLASKLYKYVYCFEGDQLELLYLKKNLKNLNNIKIINKYLDKKFTLDNFVKKHSIMPNMVKIDVEGSEIEILKNSKTLLQNNVNFLIEFHERKILKKYKGKNVIKNFYNLFKKYRYKLKFNQHHEYRNLINNGVSAKSWQEKKINSNNYAIFAYKKN